MLKSIIRLILSIILSIILTIFTLALETFLIKDNFQIVLFQEILKLIPIFLATKFLGCLIFSLISGLIFGSVEGVIRQSLYGTYFPLTLLMHMLTSLILGILGVYPLKRTRSPIFLFFLPLALFITVIIHYYYIIYSNLIYAVLSPIFLR